MKRFYTRLRLPFLAILLTIFSIRSANAQCILQGGITEPACGASTTINNVGGMQEYNAVSTNGADYTVSITTGSSGCGAYTVVPASFTATGSNQVIDVLAGGLCCWSAGGTSATLTYTKINYTNTTAGGNICVGSTRGVTVSPTPLTAGTWTVINGTGTGTITGTTFTAVSAGTVTIRFTKGNCNSDVGVTIDAAPTTATVGSNQSVCGLTSTGLGGNTPGGGNTGTWSQVSGPGTTTFSAINSGGSTATATAYGTYTYRWSISNGGTCPASTATLNVTYSQTPTTASVSSPTINVCGSLTTGSLGGNTPAVGTGTWTQTSGPGSTSFSAPNSGSSTATASVVGTYVYTWTIANGVCPSSAANVTVNYYATPTPATAGGTQNICGSLTSGSLGGNPALVGTGVWSQTSGPGTTTFSSSASAPNASATASVAGTYVYTWTISNGTCAPSTASVTVNFYATPPIAVAIPSTLNACGSLTSPPLTGNNASPGIGTWTQSAGPGTVSFSNPNLESATATVSVPGTYVFTWTITNGTCPSSNASVTVNYLAAPTTAVAGADQDTCALISSSLGGNSPTIGTGTWTQVSGPGVTFFNAVNSGSSTAAVSTQGSYVFAWTIANGGCTSADSLTVNYYSNPTVATVGGTQNVCGSLTSGNLGGNVAVIGTGTWTQASGPGTSTFSNPNDPAATATASVTGSYIYTWTISNGTCVPTSANINVNFIATPSGGSVANTAFCQAIGSGNVSVTGVSNATQYSWALPGGLSGSSTASSINVGGTIAGTYTVTVTPLNIIFGVTCTGTPITGTVEILSQPVIDSVNPGTVSCFGGSNDTLRVYAHTSNGTLFYSIDGGTTYPNSTGVFPNLTASSYFILVRDDSTCATSYSGNPVVVTQPTAIFVTIASFGDVRCNGDSTGFINISASGGTAPLTFAWSDGEITQNISNLAAGTYTLTVTDANGCNVIVSQTISEPSALTASATGTNITCHGVNNGTATVTASGGVPSYSYLWNTGDPTQSISNLGGSLYSVTVTDNNGCIAVSSYTVIDPLQLSVSLVTSNVLCSGGNGSITANASGGTGAYTYTWSPPVSVTNTVTNAAPGIYYLTVTDANGCNAVDSTVVTQPLSGLAVATIVTPVRCTGEANGAIQLLASGGVGGYTYSWTPSGPTTSIISGLPANTYTATVTDGNGCQVIVSETLTDPTPIVSSVVGSSALCAGAGGGSATLTVSGGVPGYTFLWSNFETTQNISNLSGALYRVVIKDTNGCEHRDSVIITQPQPLAVSFATTNVTCNGANDGTITATVTGGTGAYTYAWTGSLSTGPTVTGAGPGTYVLTVTDANGCTLIDSATITQPAAALSITATVTDMTCNNANDGSISTQTSGGSGSYTYAWTGSPLFTPSLSGLSAGTYTVTVTDANGCTAAASGTINNPAAITSTVTGTNVSCAGAADGTATVATVSGGTGAYTYLWTTFQTTQSISGLSGGTIRVIITDANGCQHRDSIILTEPQPIVVTLATTNVSCSGGNNGTITATVTGGTGAYSYAWTGSTSTGATVTGAGPGVYTVTVTDANNCVGTATTTITQPQPLFVAVNTTNVTCFGDSNGTINLSVSGGSGVYTYTWSPAVSTGPSADSLHSGTYQYTVTDANGCSAQGSAVITAPASPIVVTNIIHNVSCYGGHDGSILVLASGGTGAFTYLWSDGQVVQYITGLSPSPFASTTLFTVTITDANGCSAVVVDTLRNPSQITSSIVGTDVSCAGANDGTATLTVSGGRPSYTYLWSNLATTQNLTNIPGASYTVIITDSSGCRHTDTVTIREPQPLVVTLSTTNVNCFGAANGSITATVSGGTTGYSYAWTGSTSTSATVTGAGPGTYTVTVTDAHGCTQTATTTISQPASAVTLAISVTDITCHNANDGAISTQVSGGSGSYTYSWTGVVSGAPSVSGLSAGNYSVTATDANGCTAAANGVITNPADITSTVTGTNVTCAGAANGTATVATLAGGTAPYTFLWNSFAATQSVSGLSGGVARVIITDAHGCTHRDSVIITEPQPLTATFSTTNVGCNGANGTITASVSGGTGAYTYTWSPNVSSGPTVSAGAGVYHVTITDANGCQIIDSATIAAPASTLAIFATVSDMTCHDANNGSITTQTSGGSGSYSYTWSGITASTPSISGLSAGTYTVTVTDASSCTASATGTITNPAAITSSTTHTDVTCAGSHNGTAQLTVNGGQAPYTFLWSNFAGTQNLDSLDGALYRVIITDAHGCQHRDSALVFEPQPITVTLAVTQISCNNLNDGAITASATGGTGAYTYQWTGGLSSATISNLAAGTYTVTITDANGCAAVPASATIVNPSPLSVASVVINPQCNGSNNGTVTLVVNGGTQAYSYNWSGALAGSGQSAVNVAPGNYYVTVTDAHGCTATDSAKVIAPQPIFVSGIITNVSCNGSRDGSVIATVYGGAVPYSYQWHYDSLTGIAGPITKDWTQLSGGDYYLAVTDANGCDASYHAVIKEADSLKLTLSKTDVTCFGANNGTVLASPRGGTTPYHFLWNNFVTDSNQTGLAAGNYGVVVTDSNGCQQTKTINVNQPLPITVNVNPTNPACNGSATGSIALGVSGGSGAGTYTYNWSTSPAQNTNPATNLTAGTYYVTITDGNSCTQVDSATLTAPQALAVNTAVSNPTCSDGDNGFVSLDVRQGTAPYTYLWNTTPAQTGNVASNLMAGTYIATVTDAAGCQLLDTAVVVAPLPITISIGTVGNTTCFNSTDGYAVINVTGGLAPYSYQVGTVTQTSDTFRNLTSGVYALTVRDANGCQATTAWTVNTNSNFSVNLTVDHDVILAGEPIQLTATPTSDTTVIAYAWTPGDSLDFSGCGTPGNCATPTALPSSSQLYIVEATNARGCIARDTVHVTVSREESAFMPTAFTPNGDGLNDRFEFDILGAKTVDVQVWNRWGEKIYSDPAQANGVTGTHGWDGTFRGKVVEFDTYTYQLVISYLDGHQKTMAGTITIMR